MEYSIELTQRAQNDLEELDQAVAKRIFAKILRLRFDLAGDVKRLTDFEPGYRLRVGDYRVLFDIVGTTVIIRYIRHRRDAYRE